MIDARDYSVILANRVVEEAGIKSGTTCYSVTHRSDAPCDMAEHQCPLKEARASKAPVVI